MYMQVFRLVLRDTDASGPSPPSCKPFTLASNVCVGDLVVIVACSVAGIGFFCWGIHAIRKMRNDPFDEAQREAEEREADERAAAAARRRKEQGLVQVPSRPEDAYYGSRTYYGDNWEDDAEMYRHYHDGEGYISKTYLGMGKGCLTPATRENLNPAPRRAAAAREVAIVRAGDDYSHCTFEITDWGEDEEDKGGADRSGAFGSGRGKGVSFRRPESVYHGGSRT